MPSLAGVDPSAVKDAINAAQAEREAAHAEVEAVPPSTRLEAAEVYPMIDALGDVGGALKRAQPDSLVKLYRDLGIEVPPPGGWRRGHHRPACG
jgi:hypothetical protein